MHQIAHFAQTLASFALVLGVLVSIHELGHYLAARWCRVYVEAFSIGFGPALKSWTDRGGTVWKISALPIGGYVKMYGMSPHARQDAAEAGEVYRPDDAYCEKSVAQRSVIAAAGPIANFLLAMVLYAVLLGTIGRQIPLPVVIQFQPGCGAAQAGLHVGDEVKLVDGVAVHTFEDLRRIVAASPNRDLNLVVHRGTADVPVKVHILPVSSWPGAPGKLGVISTTAVTQPVGPVAAVVGGVTETWDLMKQTVHGLWMLITSGAGADDLGGPIMIAHLSGRFVQLGLASTLSFIAMLSVNLGLVNLLPIPVLDGGHLVFYAAEALRGRPVPARAQEYGYRVGLAIIASVFIFVSWNDLSREGAFRWVAHLIG
jgi:regulator of sigma E protease